jgi:RNA recognition motif-containing protein
LPFSTQWQDLKDLLRPAGRILRADIALAPDGRSKGWGTAVFATPQEAQNAIDTFDGWEVDGRIIKVRWDKYQGSTTEPSPQLFPTAGLSSPQMMQTQLSSAETPRPNDYVAMSSTYAQQNWQSQFLGGNLHPMQSMHPMPTPTTVPPPTMPMAGHTQYQSPFVQPQYANPTPSGQSAPAPPNPYASVMYNPQGGQWYPNYGASTMAPIQPLPPQVRLPSSVDTFNMMTQQQQQQNVQHNESSNTPNVYGI